MWRRGGERRACDRRRRPKQIKVDGCIRRSRNRHITGKERNRVRGGNRAYAQPEGQEKRQGGRRTRAKERRLLPKALEKAADE